MKLIAVLILACLIFAGLFQSLHFFFTSSALQRFIWEINTFHGMFANLPDNLPKEDIVGSYAYAFRDFYNHLPRSVEQNAFYYALFLGFLITPYLIRQVTKRFDLNWFQNSGFYAVIVLGLFARFFFAYHTTCNHDVVSWYIDKHALDAGQNIFAVTDRYNYSPAWFLILKFLSQVNAYFSQFPFMFIVRIFLTLIDLATLAILILIAKQLRISMLKPAALFFLNPVSIIITGYHGQFDNIPVLLILAVIYLYIRLGQKALFPTWLLVSTGMIVKHEVLQQILIFLRQFRLSKKKTVFLFVLSVGLFVLTFVPYWAEGKERIIQNVLGYSGMSRPYGLIYLNWLPGWAQIHKFLFISLLLIWPFIYRTNNLLNGSLIGMLFFLVFTSGISAQQFVLPVALGALQPTAGFALFTLAASLFLLGNLDELKMTLFSGIPWNYVWFSALIWFFIQIKKDRPRDQREKSNRRFAGL